MASARARLGAARRGIIGRQKKTDVLSGILGTASTVTAFAGTQAKKAKTAWGEYEAGYKALGGTEPIDKGGWLNRTFKGPGDGEVRIGGSMYDRGQIQKAGGVLGSDIGATLGEGARTRYMERTVPGRKAPGSIEGFDYSSLKGSGLSPEQYDAKVAGASKGATQDVAGMIVDGKQTDWTSEDYPVQYNQKPPSKGGISALSQQQADQQRVEQQKQQELTQLRGAQGEYENVQASQQAAQQAAQQRQQLVSSGSLEEQYENVKSDYDKNRILEQIRERNYQKGQYYDVESGEVKIRKKSKVTVGESYSSSGERPFSSYNRNMGGSDPGSYNRSALKAWEKQ